jgi:hypothetical protein
MGAEGSGTAEHPVSKRCRYKGSWNSFQIEIKTSSLINPTEAHEMELRGLYCEAIDVLDTWLANFSIYGPHVIESKSNKMDIA